MLSKPISITFFLILLPLIQAGTFTHVKNIKNLRKDLATYYDFFSTQTVRDEPIISIPYIDAFGTGKKGVSRVGWGRGGAGLRGEEAVKLSILGA